MIEDDKVEKRYQDSIQVKKPEGPKKNAQDEYDEIHISSRDAIKSAPPSKDSIAFTLKNQSSLVDHEE